ncbi:sensor histidine kinase [Candidatus Galacturonibacter soehngenii]|uniref:Sensor histidine kinase n=1 Tax=Candidatus Galacturonatibacter soehngenii TaxID=2307010 RepID=A0A7V7UCA4_9FIRM|nr:histidine kinase [Candidatus Galacturonibacter soehngenii]KAB1438454.1 sensor histidine kinase [Candidatus Galacturonibacter soehngenii]
MKKKYSGFQRRVILFSKISFAGLIAVSVSNVVLSICFVNEKLTQSGYTILLVLGCIFLGVLSLLFLQYVIKPIRVLEDTIETLNDESFDYKLDKDSLTDSLTRILDKYKSSIEREHAEIVLRQESEYAQLQSQINPHFLYNTLEVVRGQALIDDNYKIADMTEALAKYFRYNIGKDNDKVPLSEEIDNVYNYIKIQQYRFADKFSFHIYVHDDSKEYKNCMIPKMTLQPIVENAIFHGIEGKIGQGTIDLHIVTTEERLIVSVADDGIGMNEETLTQINQSLKKHAIVLNYSKKKKQNGIALENVNNRLKLLFGKEYGINISSTWMVGTEVEITIPKVLMEAN